MSLKRRIWIFGAAAALIVTAALLYIGAHGKGAARHPEAAVAFVVNTRPPSSSRFSPLEFAHPAVSRQTIMAADASGERVWNVLSQVDRRSSRHPNPKVPSTCTTDGPEWIMDFYADVRDGTIPVNFNPKKRTLFQPALGPGYSDGITELVDLRTGDRTELAPQENLYGYKYADDMQGRYNLVDDPKTVIGRSTSQPLLFLAAKGANSASSQVTVSGKAVSEILAYKKWMAEGYFGWKGCLAIVVERNANASGQYGPDRRIWFLDTATGNPISAMDFRTIWSEEKTVSPESLATWIAPEDIFLTQPPSPKWPGYLSGSAVNLPDYGLSVQSVNLISPPVGSRPPLFRIGIGRTYMGTGQTRGKYSHSSYSQLWAIDPRTGKIEVVPTGVKSPFDNYKELIRRTAYDPVHKCLYLSVVIRDSAYEKEIDALHAGRLNSVLMALNEDGSCHEILRMHAGYFAELAVGPGGALWFVKWDLTNGHSNSSLMILSAPDGTPREVYKHQGSFSNLSAAPPK